MAHWEVEWRGLHLAFSLGKILFGGSYIHAYQHKLDKAAPMFTFRRVLSMSVHMWHVNPFPAGLKSCEGAVGQGLK